MRHSFASICASKGIDIYRIARWLGDDVRVVQRHCAQLRPDDISRRVFRRETTPQLRVLHVRSLAQILPQTARALERTGRPHVDGPFAKVSASSQGF